MDLKDVSYLGILDSSKRVFYDLNFGNVDRNELFKHVYDSVALVNDQVLFCETKQTNGPLNIHVILLANKESNEIFVKDSFNTLVAELDKIMKNGWTVERVETKYDMIIFLFNEFVFNGIILEDNLDVLHKKLPKRTFESIGGIKVNKGLASMLNKAAKSVKNSFTLNK